MEYTIPAIPTVYKGKQYRSRLEARWAAFFDLLQWKVEYEPYDLGPWSPDFVICGQHHSILVEVKPVQEFEPKTAEKMLRAKLPGGTSIMLVGTSPGVNADFLWLGWHSAGKDEPWRNAHLSWTSDPLVPRMLPDLIVDDAEAGFHGLMRSDWTSDIDSRHSYGSYATGLWGQACNVTQWHKATKK